MRIITFLQLLIGCSALGGIAYWVYSLNLYHYYIYGNLNELYFEPFYSDDAGLNQLSVKLKYIYDLVNNEKDFMDDQLYQLTHSADKQGLSKDENFRKKMKEVKDGDQERINFIKAQLEVLFEVNKYNNEQLEKLSRDLSEKIVALHRDDDPDCGSEDLIYCHLETKNCDYGCQFQKLSACYLTAHYMNRTLVLADTSIMQKFYIDYFESPNKVCKLTEKNVNALLVTDKFVASSNFKMFLNKELKKVYRYHGEPLAWYAGHFLKHIIKETKYTNRKFNAAYFRLQKEVEIKEDYYVGLQISNADLNTKNFDDTLRKAMELVNENIEIHCFKMALEPEDFRRVVYLSIEDRKVYEMLVKNYTNYKFVYGRNEKDDSFANFYLDLQFLTKANHLVCSAASSQCRMAYELMQLSSTDKSKKFKSYHTSIPYSFNFDKEVYENGIRSQLVASADPDSESTPESENMLLRMSTAGQTPIIYKFMD